MIKKWLIPYLYSYKGTVIKKKVKKTNDDFKINVVIYYKMDWFVYEKIYLEFDIMDTTNKKINDTIMLTIDTLDEKFKKV